MNNDLATHHPVLSHEVVELLQPAHGETVIDATVGGGGHAEALLARILPGGRLIGIDRDTATLARAATRLERFGDAVRLVHGNFADIPDLIGADSLKEARMLLADLGVSSFQLDDPARGFSLRDPSAPLDMRMDPSAAIPEVPVFARATEVALAQMAGLRAAEILATAPVALLAELFRRYGEIQGAGSLARKIETARGHAPLQTAGDLLALIPFGREAQAFQALRIAVNGELRAVETLLRLVITELEPGTRVAIISFHSLEDRLVKHAFRAAAIDCICPPLAPICVCGGNHSTLRILTPRAVRASDEEVARNPRARSALLRVALVR